MEGIFESKFKLNFKKTEYEEEFKKTNLELHRKYSKIMTLCLFFGSCITSLAMSFFFKNYQNIGFKVIMVLTYFVNFLYLIMLVIVLSSKNVVFFKWVNYLVYFLLMFVFVNFRYPLIQYVQIHWLIVVMIICMELVIRLIWNVLGILGFIESLIINASQSAINLLIFGMLTTENPIGIANTMLIVATYIISLIVIVIFSYFLERQQKTAYFFYLKESKKALWLSNLFENMNTGFLSIKGDEVIYINDFLVKKLEQSKFLLNISSESECIIPNIETNLIIKKKEEKSVNSKYNANLLLHFMLSNLHTETINDNNVSKILNDFKNESISLSIMRNRNVSPDYVKRFIECVSEIPSISSFVYIGEQTLNLEDENNEINFEVYCRLNKSLIEGSELDLLFNDLTRSKINENLKSEFKYKSLFLSKVAHEFKNPLICISELIKQMYSSPEIREKLLSTNFDQNLAQIRSMSNFLLILVKDLDYFSQSQTEDKIKLEEKETNLDEMIEFCNDITNSLLIKTNKNDQVVFKVKKHVDVPKIIMTDEWRLKQVLINLISNAVKFTYYGEILLEISLEFLTKPFIKFLVKDTGMGIKTENQLKLFQPFKKGTSINNEMGAGLGLSIVRDLTKKLGGSIEFASVPNEGSSFWFHIPLEENIFSKRAEEQKPVIYGEENANIFNINKNENQSSQHTKRIDLILDKNQLDNFELNLNDKDNNQNYSRSSNLNNLIKLKNPSLRLNFVRMKSDSLSSKNITCKYNLLSNNEIKHSYCTEIVKRNTSNQKDKEIFTVLDLVLKDVTLLRILPINKKRFVNVIVADDEKITRQSTIRLLREVSQELEVKLNIIESEDGIETIYILYKSILQGLKILMILSDETMNYLNGSKSSQIIQDISIRNMPTIPFFLVTAYESFNKIKSITKVLSKPLSKSRTEEIFKEYIINNN